MKRIGVCSSSRSSDTIDGECKLTLSAELGLHGCVKRRCFKLVELGPDFPSYDYFAECSCNEKVALEVRQLRPVIRPTEAGVRGVRRQMRKLAASFGSGYAPMRWQQVVDRYSGQKKARYETAMLRLRTQLCEKEDSKLKMFVKAERVDFDAKVNSKIPKPRCILFRTYEYCLELSSYLLPIAGRLNAWKGPERGVCRTRVIAKELNSRQRGALLVKKMEEFVKPRVVSIDCEAFDSHVAPEMLEVEHDFYVSVCGGDKRLAKLLKWQLVNKGKSMGRHSFTIDGRRCSGDANTALGNCLLMTLQVVECFRRLRIKKWDMLDDGDDCLLIVELEDLDRLERGLGRIFRTFGHEVVVEKASSIPEEVMTCRCKVLHCNDGWRMVKDWRQVLAATFTSHRHYQEPKGGLRILKGILHASALDYAGVPILGVVFLRAYESLMSIKEISVRWNDEMIYRVQAEGLDLREVPKYQEPGGGVRESFGLAYDTSPEAQLVLEATLVRRVCESLGRWASMELQQPSEIFGRYKTAA